MASIVGPAISIDVLASLVQSALSTDAKTPDKISQGIFWMICLLAQGVQRNRLPAFSMWRILHFFRAERIFKCSNQKSVCITYQRSLVELLKGMTKSKRFSKLRWRAGGIYFPIIDLPSPPPVMLKPYNSHPPSHILSIICAPTVLPTPTGTH